MDGGDVVVVDSDRVYVVKFDYEVVIFIIEVEGGIVVIIIFGGDFNISIEIVLDSSLDLFS